MSPIHNKVAKSLKRVFHILKIAEIGVKSSDSNTLSELTSLDATKVKQIDFHIQFTKNLGQVFETEYDHYFCNYSEMGT